MTSSPASPATVPRARRADLIADSARLVDARTGYRWDGDRLYAATAGIGRRYAALPPGLVLARTANTAGSLLRYLAAWLAERPVALLSPALTAPALAALVSRYQPVAVVGLDEDPALTGPVPPGYVADDGWWRRTAAPPPPPHPDLAVLLPTSGSTGDPRLVRLSWCSVLANARSIAQALGIGRDETAPTSLAPHYSYGLSVINSHLAAGAELVVVDGGVLTPDFWQAVGRYRATSLAGVPQQYEMLARVRWSPAKAPTLRTLTQAGGRLREHLAVTLHGQLADRGGRLFLMYGQTEATARIAVLPADRAGDKPGSVGAAVPGGTITIRLDTGPAGTVPGTEGEVVYSGPNVMLGYAGTAADLARGDELGGVLATGDRGHLDREGHLWVTGRTRRIGKIFGTRVNLDDIERLAAARMGPVAAVAADDRVVLWCCRRPDAALTALAARLADELRLHRSGLDVRSTDALPTLPNGKVDYRALEAETRR